MFAVLFTAAVVLRRKPQSHKRLMVLATVSIMMAPTVRLIKTFGWPLALNTNGFFAPQGVFVQ